MVRRALSGGPGRIASNLTLLNDRRAERCLTSGLAGLHVLIDGATPETYEWIRVRARFDQTISSLRRLVDTRRCLGSATPCLRLVVVTMRQYLDDLPSPVRLAHQPEGILGVPVRVNASPRPGHGRPASLQEQASEP
jgi:MoaA/NifB/PqqE/SkfB family radical SAM enzyme